METGADTSCVAPGRGESHMDQMSVQQKAFEFQLECASTHSTQGNRCLGPSKGRTLQQTELIPASWSVGGGSLTLYQEYCRVDSCPGEAGLDSDL